jgi:hypothetical protein
MQLSSYEGYLKARAVLGLRQVDMGMKDSFRE